MEPLNCDGCSECCKWMTFLLHPTEGDYDYYVDFYTRRGCKLELIDGGFAVTINSVCPYLHNDRCSIETVKPGMCRKYDCRTDPFIKGGNYYYGDKKTTQ